MICSTVFHQHGSESCFVNIHQYSYIVSYYLYPILYHTKFMISGKLLYYCHFLIVFTLITLDAQSNTLATQSQFDTASDRENWQPVVVNEFISLVRQNYKNLQDILTKKKKVWETIVRELNRKVCICFHVLCAS